MIQLNLLPDVKLAFIKAERQKRLVTYISIIVIIASVVILSFLLVTVKLVQAKSIKDLGKDIDKIAMELQAVQDIDKMLTVQSQLGSLTGLHENKVVATRLYEYISQVTPQDASISNLSIDYSMSTLEVSGTVANFTYVNKFADTFKFTTYELEGKDESVAAFSNVVLSDFSRQGEEADYTLKMNFDPVLFAGDSEPTLTVPNINTTRPDSVRPTPLFQEPLTTDGEGGL